MTVRHSSEAARRLQANGHSVSEELGWWLRGKTSDAFLFELSFEDHNRVNRQRHLIAPDVPITYLGLWDPTATARASSVAEFQLGTWFKTPRFDVQPHLVQFLSCLKGVYPTYVEPMRTAADAKAFLAAIGLQGIEAP